MNTQQPRRVAIGMDRLLVQHWQWVSLSILCLLVAFTANRASVPRSDVPHRHSAVWSIWARLIQAMQPAPDEQRGEPFTGRQAPPQDPAMQSVLSYLLRAHPAEHQSLWNQVLVRVRQYVDRR